ncbi:MAG: hypothetical protein QW328_06950 [Nitrososphaerota archaeon]
MPFSPKMQQFFSEVKKNLRYTKLDVLETNEFPTGRAVIRNGRMIIEINTNTAKDDQAVKQFFLHEIAHFIRDDLTELRKAESELDHALKNFAMDCVINSQLSEKFWRDHGYVTHRGLRDKYKTDAIPLPHRGWHEIYKFLKSLPENQQREIVKEFVIDVDDDGSLSEEERIIVSSELADAVKKAVGTLEGGTGCKQGKCKVGNGALPDTPNLENNPILNAVRRAITMAYSKKHPNRTTYKSYQRSYMREGRVDGLRGVIRRPIPNIAVFCDVSGSMGEEYERISHMFSKITKECDVFLWGCALSSKNSKTGDVGGGTDPTSIVSVFNKYSSAIVVTDGVFDYRDREAVETAARKHGTRLIWVLTSNVRFASEFPVIMARK